MVHYLLKEAEEQGDLKQVVEGVPASLVQTGFWVVRVVAEVHLSEEQHDFDENEDCLVQEEVEVQSLCLVSVVELFSSAQ